MIFSLFNLSLTSGSYGDDYDAPRNPCNHSGKDYKTNQVPTAFSAAVYGKVVSLIPEWGSIGIEPFGSNDLVEYLHCSRIDVNVGDIVAPWTILGLTGEVCPPGRCNGIHLHLHVVKNSGTPKYPCWSRNYIDPNSWTYVNPIIGAWHQYSRGAGSPGVSYTEMSSNLIIASDLIPTPNQLVKVWTIHVSTRVGTCTIYITIRHSVIFTGLSNNGIKFNCKYQGHSINVVNGSGTCSNINVNSGDGSGELVLKNNGTIEVKVDSALPKGDYSKTGNYFIDIVPKNVEYPYCFDETADTIIVDDTKNLVYTLTKDNYPELIL